MKSPVFYFAILILAFIQPAGAEETFFPDDVWRKPTGASPVESDAVSYERWFGGQLAAMHERPLWLESKGASSLMSVRMTRYFSFVPPAEMIRLSVPKAGRVSFTAKVYFLCSTDDPGPCSSEGPVKLATRRGEVDETRSDTIRALLLEIEPLTSKTPSQLPQDDGGMDGTTTVFEFTGMSKFNAMVRWDLAVGSGGPLGRLQEELQQVLRETYKME